MKRKVSLLMVLVSLFLLVTMAAGFTSSIGEPKLPERAWACM